MKYSIKLLLALLLVTGTLQSKAQSWDLRLLEHINGPVNPGPDSRWRFVTNTMAPVAVAEPLGLLIAGHFGHNEYLKQQALVGLVAIGGSAILSTGVKLITHRERPYLAYPDLITGKHGPTDYSFPSGHVTTAFATATSLSLAIPKWYVIVPSYTYAAAVGYSRMYLGVHYPSDVLGGAILGSGTAFLTYKANQWLRGKKKNKTFNSN
ncbi:phosphatase PAP2 family protein [Mucilaginibacter sp.]|jgi:undecaprenyl-diphosphatase|uniref:phosphatase PAP2 family protein n=1 Tax=Mucilaginibacter sp. TaxID=1882438 RepID=UPI00356454E2